MLETDKLVTSHATDHLANERTKIVVAYSFVIHFFLVAFGAVHSGTLFHLLAFTSVTLRR